MSVNNSIIQHLYRKEWFGSMENAKLQLRIYSLIGIPVTSYEEVAQNSIQEVEYEKPVRILYTSIKDFKFTDFFAFRTIADENGFPCLKIDSTEVTLPEASYVLLSIPFSGENINAETGVNSSILNQAVALIRMHIGNNFLRDLIYECILEIPMGNMQSISPLIIQPLPCEGPFVNILQWNSYKEVFQKLKSISVFQKNRIELALDLFGLGSNTGETNKFFYYWVAFEVLCDTHSTGKIKTQLANAYGKDGSFIINTLGFEYITKRRQAFFHNGERIQLRQDVERYIQLLFLDLLRYKLSLPNYRYALTMIEQGFDISLLKEAVFNNVLLKF